MSPEEGAAEAKAVGRRATRLPLQPPYSGLSGAAADVVTPALDRAVAHAYVVLADAAPRDGLERFLTTLRESVDRMVNGDDPPPWAPTGGVPVERVCESISRTFIELLEGCDPPSAHRALRVLAALRQVQRMRAAAPDAVRQQHTREALELAMEVAHDFRSPLTAILFLIDTLRSGRSGPITPVQAHQLGIVYGAAFGLSQVATDLIDHVKGHNSYVEQKPLPFSVRETLFSVRDILAPVVEERKIQMRVEVLDDDDGRLGFPTALHRILLNLATNGVKFTTKGSVTLRAHALDSACVEFAVVDTGPGIPRRVQAQLFDSFRPAPPGQRASFSSAGLGLFICNSLVSALGGQLRVSSVVGRGTTFRFSLELPRIQS